MTAVRLRGQDAIDRALEVRRQHLEDHLTVDDLAEFYGCAHYSIYRWLQLAKKHTLPDMNDKQGWFELILQDQGSRLEDAKDSDSVALAKNLSQLLGVGSAEELKAHMARLETAKVALVAQAFDEAIADLPNRQQLRERFMDVLRVNELAASS